MSSNQSAYRAHPGSGRRRTLLLTTALAAVLGVMALAVERSAVASARTDAENRLDARLAGHASALELGLGKRATLLNSMVAWIREEQGDPGASYTRFIASLHGLDPGLRALQRVEHGLIVASYPEEGNQGVLGFNLMTHPEPTVTEGLLRALDTGGITLTAPVALIQGGAGVILRRSAGEPGDRDAPSAALVLDVGTLVSEARIPALSSTLDVAIIAGDGTPVFGTAPRVETHPRAIPVSVPEGAWTLVAAPRDGWPSTWSGELASVRLALLLVLVLSVFLAYALADRDTRLKAAVAARTHQLTEANRELEEVAAKLAEREQRLSAALAAGRITTWWWDVRSDEINLFGPADSEDRAPTNIASLLQRAHPDDRAGLAKAVDQARRTGQVARQYRLDMGGGAYRWLQIEGSCREHDEEGPARIVGAAADITRVKELETELLHGGRLELMGQLAGGVAHDLNNALSVISAELELGLLDTKNRERALVQGANRAMEATQYASLLIGQLLTFARKDHVQASTFEWDAMCTEVGGFLARLLGRTVELDLELAAGDAAVHMDRAHAMQILTNLAVNARDAMGGVGTVTLATRTVARGSDITPDGPTVPSVVLEVRDTGGGIPAEVQDRVFEAFFTTKGATKGTGLGLSTTHRIVRDNGGRITFRTSPQGTTFVVVLPRVEAGGPDEE